MSRHCFLIAGEASGDMHAAHLVSALRAQCPTMTFAGVGGEKMAQAGVSLCLDYGETAFMGIVDVVRNMGRIRRNFRIVEQALLAAQPEVVVLIDYPSFNLRIARYCRKHLPQARVVWYIPPKVWAWKSWRVHRIAQESDLVLGIFPFEPAFYRRYGYECTYVGNPTASALRGSRAAAPADGEVQELVLLPGSRLSEVRHCLPVMLEAARCIANTHITVTAAPGIADEHYTRLLGAGETLTRDTYEAVRKAHAAIVNSGTATLETALLGCPQVAVYHLYAARLLGWLRPILQHRIFRTPYFTLVNILAGREVIRELVANDFTADKVETEVRRLLTDRAAREDMLREYRRIEELLGEADAPTEAARLILRI